MKSLFKVVVWFLPVVLCSACWSPSKDKSHSRDAASFYVRDAQGQFLPSDPSVDLSSTVWQSIDAHNYKFRVCLNDHFANQAIREAVFRVSDGHGRTYPDTTDAQGCLEWTERFPFNFFAQRSVYVLIERKIRGDSPGDSRSGYRGEVTVQFAINPWQPYRDTGVPGVIFLNNNQSVVPRGQLVAEPTMVTQALGGDGQLPGQLWMGDMRVTSSRMEPATTGHDIEMQIEMKPQVVVQNLIGESRMVPIPSGQFRLQSYLIASNYAHDAKPLILNPMSPPTTSQVFRNDGVLRFTVRTRIERRVSEGRLLLALKVLPMNGPNLRSYESLFLVGELSDLRGTHSPVLTEEIWGGHDTFAFDTYISAENTANFEALQAARVASTIDPIDFETAQVRFERIATGETSTTRTVEYRVTTCLIDNLSLRRVPPGQRYSISFEGGAYQDSLETDSTGCIRFLGQITHKYYDPQRVIFQSFRIRKIDSCSGDFRNAATTCFDKVLRVGVNPWDYNYTFGRDAREWTEEYIARAQSINSVPSRFVIDQYSYNTLGFRYEVDEFLNMKVIKRIYLRIDPMVLLHHSITRGRNYMEPLRDGVYLLKVAMHRDYLDTTSKSVHISTHKADVVDPGSGQTRSVQRSFVEANPDQRPRTFVSVVKKIVRVQRGVIVTPVELRLRDLRLMSVRANLLIQIEPIDELLLQRAIAVERRVEGMSEQEASGLRDMLAELERQRRGDMEAVGDSPTATAPMTNEDSTQGEAALEGLRTQTLSEFSGLFARLQAGVLQAPDPVLGPFDLNWLVQRNLISSSERERIERNDFNDSRLVSNFDYDLFVDRNAGLAKRTFVGPLKLLENTSSSSMVPTDAIDEIFCRGADCNQLGELESNRGRVDTSNFENLRFFGSIQHLQNVHVDDLIQLKVELETNYYREQFLGSLVSSFVDTFNLKFVSLGDEVARDIRGTCNIQPRMELLRFQDWHEWQARVQREFAPCLFENPNIQERLEPFLNKLNENLGWFGGDNRVNAQSLDRLVRTGNVSKLLGERLCDYWSKYLYRPVIESGPSNLRGAARRAVDLFNYTCKVNLGSGQSGDPQDSFIVDRKIRVRKVGAHQYKGGKSINLSVSSNFQLQRSEGTNIHGTVGFDPLGVPVIRDIINNPAKGGINLNYNVARNRTDSTSIQEQTYLVMQTAALAIELEEYEYCAVVRVNPKVRDMYAQLNRFFRPDLRADRENERQRHLATGLYICTGRGENTKIPIIERYFYITQHFTEGDMLDVAEFYNRPWLLSLRGVRDMRTFLRYIREQDISISFDHVLSPLNQGDFFSASQLAQAYSRVLPSFPGVYTLINERSEQVSGLDYPFSSDPYQAFDRNLDRLGVGVYNIERFSGTPPGEAPLRPSGN